MTIQRSYIVALQINTNDGLIIAIVGLQDVYWISLEQIIWICDHSMKNVMMNVALLSFHKTFI